ncbi:MAG: methyltransferase [Candidatus Cloacimonetes bacterium]|nr:methyltransferase [Candidatus Cloacimonadota bacterium]MDD4100683.1 methyltransferase [Candidatus Cloacimonadota bacterium]MDD4806496.1 methyltransferase [Candidatus Cloacimonadota bacterium]
MQGSIRELQLPFPGKVIRQDTLAQGVSLASALLYEAAIQHLADLPSSVADFGCGCGIVSIMCALARPRWQIQGIDIQENLIELARSNAAACKLDIRFLHQDIRKHENAYDLILANPPWQKKGGGLLSPHQSKNLSRVEISCNMQDLLSSFERCLKPGGCAIVIYPESRLADLINALANTSLDIVSHHPHFGKKAYFTAKLKIGNR